MIKFRDFKALTTKGKDATRFWARRPSGFAERMFLATLLLLLAVAPSGLAANRDLEVTDVESTRFEGERAGFSGVVKVNRQKPIDGLLLTLEFLDAQGVLLSIQRQAIAEGALTAGDEVAFDLEGRDVPRAVSFRVVMFDSKKMLLSVDGAGPYPF